MLFSLANSNQQCALALLMSAPLYSRKRLNFVSQPGQYILSGLESRAKGIPKHFSWEIKALVSPTTNPPSANL
jgi:hypothetical protein